jgi:hypothetical protein
MWFHLDRAVITWGSARCSWRVPGIQEAPFTTQLPLRHAALGTVSKHDKFGKNLKKLVHILHEDLCLFCMHFEYSSVFFAVGNI